MCSNILNFAYLDQLSNKYDSPIRIWLGPLLLVYIVDAETVEIVLKSKYCLNKPQTFYKMVRDGLGMDGLFTLSDEFPRKQNKKQNSRRNKNE